MAGATAYPLRSVKELCDVLREIDRISPVVRLLLEFEARTGLRYVDASRVKFSDVMINGVIRDQFTIVQSKPFKKRVRILEKRADEAGKKVSDTAISNAKKASEKTVNLNSELKELIEDVAHINQGCTLLFESTHHLAKKGNPVSIQYVNRVLKLVAQKLKLPYQLSTHSMRKTFAMFLLENNADIRVIMKGLGQSSLTSTQHYLNTFLDPEKHFTDKISFQV